jgi:8-amino-7-oxononanoate synthase
LINHARSFLFTTALPPSVCAAAAAALDLAAGPEGDARRLRLHQLVARFARGLHDLALVPPGWPARSHIVPIRLGDSARTMAVSQALLERGVLAQGIRPPTVPPGTARLRFALSAAHTDHHIDQALNALADIRSLLP